MHVVEKQVIDTIKRLLETMKKTTHKGRRVISIREEDDVPIGFFSIFFFKTKQGDYTSYSTQLGIVYPDGIIDDINSRVKQSTTKDNIIY